MNHNSNLIQTKLDHFRSLPFPRAPRNDDFADWIADLAEVEAYYVGAAITILNQGKIRIENVEDVERMAAALERLRALPEKGDRAIVEYCTEYIAALEELANSLLSKG